MNDLRESLKDGDEDSSWAFFRVDRNINDVTRDWYLKTKMDKDECCIMLSYSDINRTLQNKMGKISVKLKSLPSN
jgi:hypothetical protein